MAHRKLHYISSTADHTGITGTEDNFMSQDANGLPKDSGYKASDFSASSHTHDHGSLTGLDDDDHDLYMTTNGSKAFSSTVSGITPTQPAHLVTKEYVDALVQGIDWQESVLDKDLCSPPGGPATGDRYIVCSGTASGTWTGQENNIVEWTGSQWDVTSVSGNEGMATWVEDEDAMYVWNGNQWVKFGSIVDHGNLSGLLDDDHPQYHNDTRGDARYYTQTYIDTLSGALSAEIDSDIATHAADNNAHHNELHTIASHSDTSATGPELDTLTDGSNADALHYHNYTNISGTVPSGALPTHYHSTSEIVGLQEFVEDTIGNAMVGAGTVTVIYDDGTGTITVSGTTGTGSGVSDHGALTGLADDDHTQYLLATGTRSLTGDWDYGSQAISGTGDVHVGELSIKVYSQAAEPTLNDDNNLAIWVDTDDSNATYLLFRRGSGDQVGVELA